MGMPKTNVLRLLTILALLFGSFSMMGGHALMAMPHQSDLTGHAMEQASGDMPEGHCANMGHGQNDQGKKSSGMEINCLMACSVMLTSIGGIGDQPALAGSTQPLPAQNHRPGLNPEHEPPPPRLA